MQLQKNGYQGIQTGGVGEAPPHQGVGVYLFHRPPIKKQEIVNFYYILQQLRKKNSSQYVRFCQNIQMFSEYKSEIENVILICTIKNDFQTIS
eukprot:TRINITY_DN94295_c0_g1_i1.p2 TRINITY_DN94295_c0_g1~~TRINITY_DN94295_c0_g1_i1.p2  ORF type:complete len:109 (+),score=2.71 TRINITY_DN94295_c0_g1_i1:51-329(+)